MSVTVVEEDVRPARPDGTCFYCRAALGALNRDGCVLVRRKVRVRVTMDLVTDVPYHWSEEEALFYWNEGTTCVDNIVEALARYLAENEEVLSARVSFGPCMCSSTKVELAGPLDGEPCRTPNEATWEPAR